VYFIRSLRKWYKADTWSRVPIGKATVAQLVKISTAFLWTQKINYHVQKSSLQAATGE
jgi:hypothetical protein